MLNDGDKGVIIDYYKANAGPHKRLGAMIEKMGLDEFRKAVLGDEPATAPSPTTS